MAASLSRPDPSSPASVAEAAFGTARRGYQPDEVRAFLTAVASEMGRLQERERQLEAELKAAREMETTAELDDETVANLLGEETLRVLQTARESASQIKIRAEDTAARILREANDEANRLRQDADVEVARRRQDATSDAEAEVALAKQQGREMVNEARAYRERVLADLDRRTTLARQQIEELIHGRDRLLQVFERARLVAVDVTTELKVIDSPDELVNLAPTTGPVPIMVPTDRDAARELAADREATAVDDLADDSSDGPDDLADDSGDGPDDLADDSGDGPGDDEPAQPVVDDDRAPPDAAEPTGEEEEAADAAEETGEATEPIGDDEQPADTAEHDRVEDDGDEHARDEDEDDGVEDAGVEDVARADEADAEPAGDAVGADETEGDESHDDTNVVSLFRDRGSPADVESDDDRPTTESDPRPDVDGIFERLRQAVPDTGESEGTSEDDADDGDGAVPAGDGSVNGEAADGDSETAPETTAFTRRDEALVPLIVGAARRLKRVLADEQNDALDTLRRSDPVVALDELVPAADAHAGVYVAALTDDLQSAAAAGAAEAGKHDTKTLRKKLTRAGALDAAKAHLRSALVAPLRDRLQRAIRDGDGDNSAIAKSVRAVYREWKTQHIDDQLDDLFRSAYSGGLHAVVDPGTPVVWAVDPGDAACPDCEDNSLAGAVPAGDQFPTGHVASPAHPGCTCLTLPES